MARCRCLLEFAAGVVPTGLRWRFHGGVGRFSGSILSADVCTSEEKLAQFQKSADQLAEALNTDIAWVRQHTDFGEQARRWALAKQPNGLLLRYRCLSGKHRHYIHLNCHIGPCQLANDEERRGRYRSAAESLGTAFQCVLKKPNIGSVGHYSHNNLKQFGHDGAKRKSPLRALKLPSHAAEITQRDEHPVQEFLAAEPHLFPDPREA
jgi:hypothetical protein